MAKKPTDFMIGSKITFRAGPTKVERHGVVLGHEGPFILVDVNGKSLKARPGTVVQ